MKTCSKCQKDKELSEFSKDKSVKDGYARNCKTCRRIEYFIRKESDSFMEYRRNWYVDNKDENNIKSKKYNAKNKKEISNQKKKYYEENKEEILKKRKDKYEKWKEILESNPDLLNKKRENDREKMRIWRDENKEMLSNRIKDRKKKDPLYKLTDSIRTLIWISIDKMGYTKESKTCEILGCTFEEFKIHIESLFKDGMSWNNYGEWHLDHKTPISWAKTEEEVYRLNNYNNFQPLWAIENTSKGNKWSD